MTQAPPWQPASWQSRPAAQQPTYPDSAALARVVEQLSQLPPLVTSWEIEALKAQLAEAAQGKRFLLQGGDCAESFEDCRPHAIANKLKILLQMSLVLVHGMGKRVIRVGRFAGQYAKPRSADSETRPTSAGQDGGGGTLPAYRGDIVNGAPFTKEDRTPDPQRLLRAHERAALTLNFIRALIDGGFADLHHPEYWDLDFVKHSPRAADYQKIVEEIGASLRFMETLAGQTVGEMQRVDFYTSHEALHLLYEQALTRRVPRRDGWYNLGTHFPWIGLRTADLSGAHVEYMRGIRNPIAIKIGPAPAHGQSRETGRLLSVAEDDLIRMLDILDPVVGGVRGAGGEPGRITLIHRFGAHHIARALPALIRAVQQTRRTVLYVCDPMHGNTTTIGGSGPAAGMKTRSFDHILAEMEQAVEIHRAAGTVLAGVHVELTGENVTECTGGARNVSEDDLARAYRSQVDPRLNYEQALELAMRIAKRAR